jgi:hypothetical protein
LQTKGAFPRCFIEIEEAPPRLVTRRSILAASCRPPAGKRIDHLSEKSSDSSLKGTPLLIPNHPTGHRERPLALTLSRSMYGHRGAHQVQKTFHYCVLMQPFVDEISVGILCYIDPPVTSMDVRGTRRFGTMRCVILLAR